MNSYHTSAVWVFFILSFIGCDTSQSSAESHSKSNPFIDPPLLKDIDGNTYFQVGIGDQVWMAENLRTTRYRNGDEVPFYRSDWAWENKKEGMRCAYTDDEENLATYGQLYNWFAVVDPRGLCPVGWHVPTNEDWSVLEHTLSILVVEATKPGEEGIDARVLKSRSWDGNGASGFRALPGGFRDNLGHFYGLGTYTAFWSSSPSATSGWFRFLNSDDSKFGRHYYSSRDGFSVRCVRD